MEKKELLGILGDFKRGDLTLNEANERILVLFNVVGQSEQLVCDKCDKDGWIKENKGDIIESRLCNCNKAN